MAVALLAPLPEEHLLSGRTVCLAEGKVAFGSKNWELFYTLHTLADRHEVGEDHMFSLCGGSTELFRCPIRADCRAFLRTLLVRSRPRSAPTTSSPQDTSRCKWKML